MKTDSVALLNSGKTPGRWTRVDKSKALCITRPYTPAHWRTIPLLEHLLLSISKMRESTCLRKGLSKGIFATSASGMDYWYSKHSFRAQSCVSVYRLILISSLSTRPLVWLFISHSIFVSLSLWILMLVSVKWVFLFSNKRNMQARWSLHDE